MLPEQQQRIMGYFIEEAKDHLNTIEQGLINLQATIEDSEMVHEVFRAAHSVKGGAAMLGLTGIQHTAHRLEDYFKVLKECPGVKTTRKLETLFLRVFDTLAALIEQLQGPFGLTEDKSAELMAAVEPVFAELSQSLSEIVSQTGATLPEDVELSTSLPIATLNALSVTQARIPAEPIAQEESAIQLIFQSDVPALLRQMLQLFKQPDTLDTREQLLHICEALAQPGEQLDLPDWCNLIEGVKRSIACSDNPYRVLAPVVIKEVKQAQELVLAGRSIEIAPSQSLLDLLPTVTDWDSEAEIEQDFSAWFNVGEDAPMITDSTLLGLEPEALFATSIEAAQDAVSQPANGSLLDDLFASNGISEVPIETAADEADATVFDLFDGEVSEAALEQTEPETGAADFTLQNNFSRETFDLTSAEEADWIDAFDEFDSPLSEMDTVLELGEAENPFVQLPHAFAQEQFGFEDEALTLDDGDDDLSALLEAVQPSHVADAVSASSVDLEAELFADLEASANGLESLNFAEEPDWMENTLDFAFENQAGSGQAAPEQSDREELLSSAFTAFDFPFDAPPSASEEASEPEFFELFMLEPAADPSTHLSAIDPPAIDSMGAIDSLLAVDDVSEGNFAAADFDRLFEMAESPEANGSSQVDFWLGDTAAEFNELTFDAAEPDAEPTRSEGFADLFGQNTPSQSWIQAEATEDTVQLPDLPLDTEIAADLWLDSEDLSDLAELIGEEDSAALLEGDLAEDSIASQSPDLVLEVPEPSNLEQTLNFNLSTEARSDNSLAPSELISQEDVLDPEDEQFQVRDETHADGLPNGLDEEFDEAPVQIGGNAIEDFGDLEALLSDEAAQSPDWSEAAIESEIRFPGNSVSNPLEWLREDSLISAEEDFADLEAMLQEVAVDTPTAALVDPLENSAADPLDEFADLEALLEETPPTSPPQVDDLPTAGFASSWSANDDEFGDLEALIKDVDQVLGVGSSPVRKATSAVNRRPSRRNVLKDQTIRVSVKHLDNLNNLVGEMVVNRNSLEQAQERLRQFLDNLLYQVQQLSDVGQRMRDLYERSLLERSLLSSRRGYSGTGTGSTPAQTSHAIGVNFDALEIDQFSPFHTLSQEMIELIVRVREASSDIDFVVEESDQVTRNFRQITTQLQEGLTRSRMVPFAQTADRLPRGVRDNLLKYGKQAELAIEGRETLIDKMIVDQLSDPMTHIVNNAIAHGIETPEERIAAGKSPTGRITIRAFHQGNQTIISVSDDGAGINPERVKAKALERGLITPAEANGLSRLEIYDLLFHHGFSTVDQADDLRGRGVGLDVVRNNLNEIRGSITIDSAIGKGTTFTIRLPLTLSISKALCCISNRARIAFPMDGIEDMFDIPKDRLQTDEQGVCSVPWRDMVLPLQSLSDLLRYNRMLGRGSLYGGNQEEDVVSVVVLRSAGAFLALQVDQVLGEQEIVIKQLEGPVPKPIGVAGATVLGDGRIMPIADVLELIDLWQGRIRRESGTTLWERDREPIVEETSKTEPTVLIVDDSITVRELLSMTFSKVGYRVEQARDGQEAWEKLRSGLPCNLVFCDIEMPRMDGLELLSRLQKDPTLSELPIAMLTSRGADRHKQMAIQLGAKGYFTKPYLEEVLLDAAQRMLRGEVLVNGSPTSTIN